MIKKTGSRRILHKFLKGVDLFERRLICTENKFCIPLKKGLFGDFSSYMMPLHQVGFNSCYFHYCHLFGL